MAKKGEKAKAGAVPVKKEQSGKRLNPAHLMTPFEEMEQWMQDFFPARWLSAQRKEWPFTQGFADRIPKIDLIDREDEVFIKAELPGIDKNDIEISMTDHTITIKGSSKKEEKEEKGDYYHCEISQGTFSRSISLPAGVNADQSTAKFKDGVLELSLPKVEPEKRRTIKVN